MTIYTTDREHQRLLEIAREYRERGYEVVIEPDHNQLPDFLQQFRVDMIAHNSKENVIIEIRTQESLTYAPELDAIAQAIDSKPFWRFELVVTNPRDHSATQFKDAHSLDSSDIIYRLREAQELSYQEHGEAALLLAWSATEAILRYIAKSEAIPALQHKPNSLAKSLFTYGIIDRNQYAILLEGLQARNMLVHGYKEQVILAQSLHKLLDVANQLKAQYISV